MKKYQIVIVIGVIVVLLIVLLSGTFYFFRAKDDLNSFKAVFLSSGQVYFGKVLGTKRGYLLLSDIYYLEMKQPLQDQKAADANQPDLSLVKLGNELHGPTDEMSINKDQILFIETLKDDSKVVQAIANYAVKK